MASIPLVSGGSQPVFAIDQRNGPVAAANATYQPAGTPTNFAGPALEFYGVDLGADPSGQAGVNGAIQTILQTIQQTTTIAFYQVAATANATNLSLATYPVGAFGDTQADSATALQAVIRSLGSNVAGTGYSVAAANVTNVGFRLATTAGNAA
jgi:hypothetical protein